MSPFPQTNIDLVQKYLKTARELVYNVLKNHENDTITGTNEQLIAVDELLRKAQERLP